MNKEEYEEELKHSLIKWCICTLCGWSDESAYHMRNHFKEKHKSEIKENI